MLRVMNIETVIIGWAAVTVVAARTLYDAGRTVALGPAIGAILRHQSRYYPPVR